MKENLVLSRSRDFGELINDTFVFSKQNWKPLFKSLIAICGFFILATIIAGVSMQSRILSSAGTEMLSDRFGIDMIANYFFALLSYTSIGLTTFCYISVYKDKGNQPASVEEVWTYFKYYFWRFLGAEIVLWAMVVAGFFLCAIPGIYLTPIVSVMLAMIVFENASLGYVFNRSFKLMKNEWWATFGAFVVIGIVIYAVLIALILPVSIASGASMYLTTRAPSLSFAIAMSVLQNMCYLFMALSYVVVALAYFSIVEKKEGLALIDQVEKIGNEDASSDLPEEEY